MVILDDILLAPLRGVLWIARQIHAAVEEESLDERSVHRELLENELALEESRLDRATYEERATELLARLRAIKLRQKAEADAALAGAASRGFAPTLELEVDLEGYGPDAGASA